MTNTVDLFNPHDGLTGRDGGPYLDEVERHNAEVIRAAKENRKPDFDKAPATAGTPLVTGATLVNMVNPASNPSQTPVEADAAGVASMVKDKKHPLHAFGTRDELPFEVENREAEESNDLFSNPASPVAIGQDASEEDSDPTSEEDSDPTKDASEEDSDPTKSTPGN